MPDTEIPRYRCGYCSSPAENDVDTNGRCGVCGSALYDCHHALQGANNPEYIRRALKSRDRAWGIVDETRNEIQHRRLEDLKEGRDPTRFRGLPSPFADE